MSIHQLCLYLCADDVALDLLYGNWDVLQNDLQPHGHHTGHPVHQTGADVARHAPLETTRDENTVRLRPHEGLSKLLSFLYSFCCVKKLLYADFCHVFDLNSSLCMFLNHFCGVSRHFCSTSVNHL